MFLLLGHLFYRIPLPHCEQNELTLAVQPTKGDWYAEETEADSERNRNWLVRGHPPREPGNFPDTYICRISKQMDTTVDRAYE